MRADQRVLCSSRRSTQPNGSRRASPSTCSRRTTMAVKKHREGTRASAPAQAPKTAGVLDPALALLLETRLIPEIVGSKGATAPIRAWVPACGEGEGAYSLAMALLEQ